MTQRKLSAALVALLAAFVLAGMHPAWSAGSSREPVQVRIKSEPAHGYGPPGYGWDSCSGGVCWWWLWVAPYHPWGWAWPGLAVVPSDAIGAGQAEHGTLATDIRPRKSVVFVNGKRAGEAREFRGSRNPLQLPPGPHLVEFRCRSFMTLRVRIDVAPGGNYRIDDRLEKGSGLDPRSTAGAEEAHRKGEPGAAER